MNMHNLLQADLLQIITSGRLLSIAAAVVGLIGLVIGRLALARSASHASSARRKGFVALAMGLTGVFISGWHLASTTGGFGTGKGRAGAIVALVVGLISIILGGLALARSRRMVKSSNTAATAIDKERT